ncbi:alpha/beta-hydrolase [Gloeophyllum trabeum ATCC 11539]|uniref:Alpha/beta-hydrolase n=2 Tax=Gloeophyllum trabeum (strain ATCC 11539 / FP-39264 / Madison 617) TaxID=670483 RepID=S7Q3X3_GLOTA|nr:alpha/beta-hydrolase [Gloeophyllum trabeum ATCC 11539]EPQ54706.1 alpha/beta-hydrolase [Gloeophyllum trabeum ATCC 11539]
MSEQPFKISVPDSELALLRQKLALTRLPDELDGAGWDYGVPLADMQRLVARWRDGYDWRKHEAELNELPHFTRDIEVNGFGTLNIHYLHRRSQVEGAVPLFFVHGWPGSFFEARKILPLLTAASPDQPSFHVVVLELPGYGFSQGTKQKGFAMAQYAEVGHKLMLALGYNEYVTQGGDWGYYVTRKMASLYGPKHVKAWHTNFTISDTPKPHRNPLLFLQLLQHALTPFSPYTPAEQRGLARSQAFRERGAGYYFEQSTQPQTLGYSLADSPAGLLAWVYEKLVRWTDKYPWEDDEGRRFSLPMRFCEGWTDEGGCGGGVVLTWISIYWFARAGPANSVRIYYEVEKAGDRALPRIPHVPMGVSYFPAEAVIVPKSWMRALVGNVVFEADHESGGHFAAYERPEELVGDLRKMFGRGGPAFGVVPGLTGYAS